MDLKIPNSKDISGGVGPYPIELVENMGAIPEKVSYLSFWDQSMSVSEH